MILWSRDGATVVKDRASACLIGATMTIRTSPASLHFGPSAVRQSAPTISADTAELDGSFLVNNKAIVQGFISDNEILAADFTATFVCSSPVYSSGSVPFGLPVAPGVHIPIDPKTGYPRTDDILLLSSLPPNTTSRC
jgi:hypothetical protein